MVLEVPWTFDDTNEESLLGDFQLDTERVQKMLSPDMIKKQVENLVHMPGQIHKNRRKWLIFLKECFEPSYAKFHVGYIFLCCLIGGLLLYAIENGTAVTPDLTMIDALFISTSAVCVTGLSTSDVSKMTLESQILIMFLCQAGSSVMGTIATVVIRRYYFRTKWPHVVDPNFRLACAAEEAAIVLADQSLDSQTDIDPDVLKQMKKDLTDRVKAHEDVLKRQVEYRALGKLIYLVTFYILGLYLWAFIILAPYMTYSPYAQQILAEQGGENGPINPIWFSVFHIISAFNNAGFSLLSTNLVPFAESRVFLLVLSVLIACGNTAFPFFLRFIIYVCRHSSRTPAPYKILLVRPRALFTHLFPSTESRQLSLTWIATTLFQYLCFIILNRNRLPDLSTSEFLLTAWFNSVCTRTAGFNTTDLAALNNGMLVIYAVMMYTSSYPFTVTLHDSAHVEKEVYLDEEDEVASRVERNIDGERLKSKRKRGSFARSLLKAISFHGINLFLQHIVWLFLCWFLIASFEADQIQSKEEIFRIIFEIASSYGTVGLSLGWSGGNTSFSTTLTVGSKLLMMSVMFIGRHRGLPSSLDPAISLFQEKKVEEEEKKKEKEEIEKVKQEDEEGATVVVDVNGQVVRRANSSVHFEDDIEIATREINKKPSSTSSSSTTAEATSNGHNNSDDEPRRNSEEIELQPSPHNLSPTLSGDMQEV